MSGWNALLAAVGGVSIAFGVLMMIVSLFLRVEGFWIWGNVVVGALLLAAAVAQGADSLRERMASGEARRVGKYGTSAVLSTLIGVLILGMLGFLSTRYSKRFDWSEQGVHTLTDQTRSVLEGLDRDVSITAFFNELDAPPIRDLLERYEYASPRVVLEFADPNARPDLIELYGIDEAELSRGLVRVALGDESVNVTEFSEEKLTNALVSLSRSADRKIYFLSGHNERSFEGEEARNKEGLEQAAEALRNENYQVASLLVAQVGDVPADADAVVIAGPTRPLPPEEIAALERYRERGGSLLVMLDPRAKTNLSDVLSGWGIEVGDDIIVDLQLAFFQQYMSPFAGAYDGEHPITKKMGEQRTPVLFHLARSVEGREGAPGEVTTIVFTGEKSWAERDLDRLVQKGEFQFDQGSDRMGPIPIVVAATAPIEAQSAEGSGTGEARLVVVGDSDFATNEFMVRYGGNRDLFVNAINWLLGDVEAISIRPHQARASRFVGSEEDVRAIQYLSLFVLPEAIALLGVFAWWWRRKAPGR